MDTREVVFGKLSEQMGVSKESIKDETTFLEMGADSLDMVEFSMDVEDTFNITINPADMENIKNVGQAIEFIEKNKK
jgi:acyl carrier protein